MGGGLGCVGKEAVVSDGGWSASLPLTAEAAAAATACSSLQRELFQEQQQQQQLSVAEQAPISQRQYCVVEVTTTAPSHTGCQANKLPLSLGDLFCHLFLLPCACLPACHRTLLDRGWGTQSGSASLLFSLLLLYV